MTGLAAIGNTMPGIVAQGVSGTQIVDNVISSNFIANIVLLNASDSLIQRNIIGLDKDGNALAGAANDMGVYILGLSNNNLV